jgi:hypothetical protein
VAMSAGAEEVVGDCVVGATEAVGWGVR